MKIRSQKREAIMTRRQLSVKFEKENLSREKLNKIRNRLYKLHINQIWKRVKQSLKGKAGWHINVVKLQTVFFLGD